MHASPRAIGRYEIIDEVATGGMATVYLGRMRRPMGFTRLVAIKSMHPQYAKAPGFVSMFVDEARLTARVRHPNVVPTLDIVADAGQLVIVMEYVEGETLGTLFRAVKAAGERIPAHIACAIAHDLLLGLHEAHETTDEDGSPLAIIHRDVSPQNVLVGVDGLTRVLDFGVAKARRCVHNSLEGEIKGKIPYMPPEQLFGEAIDRRVDVYAAGVLLWESLTGARLFDGPTDEALVARITEEHIDAPSTFDATIPAELDQLVLRALARNASDRFTSALAMAERLTQVARVATRTEVAAWIKRFAKRREIPASVPPPSVDPMTTAVVDTLERAATTEPTKEERRRFPLWIAIAALALVLGAAGVGWRARGVAEAAPIPVTAAVAAPVVASAPVTVAAPVETAKAAEPTEVKPVPKRSDVRTMRAILSAKATDIAAPSAAPVTQDEAKPSVSCRPPYTVDAEGHRHYKPECL